MKTVYKYPLEVTDQQTVRLPRDHKVLCVQTQYDKPFIWALVDTQSPNFDYLFHTIATGAPADRVKSRQYIGTYQLHDGALVFHVFMNETPHMRPEDGPRG